MVGAGHAAYTDRFHELARLVPHLVTPKSRKIERYMYGLAPQIRGMVVATEPKTMQKVVQIFGALTDEPVWTGSIKKVDKRGNMGEPSKDTNGRDDNMRTRTRNAFATTVNPVGSGHIHEKHGQLGDLSSVSQPRKAVRILKNDTIESIQTVQYVGGNDVGHTSVYEVDVSGNLQRCPVATSATTGQGLVNDSLIINEPPVDASYLPNVETIADLFNVPLKFLKDIDVLTRRIKAGECEDVMMAMTSVERKAAMEAIEAVWKKIVYILLFLTKTIQLLILLILWGQTNLLVMRSS
ncbi:hypothetical protein Tco_0872397 [Tanacetum coccineum]